MTTGNTGDYNTGDYNTGYFNTGSHNTGNRNTGNRNTGYYNTGEYNTGSYNTGRRNAGYYNTGDYNTGKYNTGEYNTGSYNTGNDNTGSYNTGSRHVGCFNTTTAKQAYYFNKLLDVSEWESSKKPMWLSAVKLTEWVSSVDMSDKEKAENPSYKATGGYLRVNDRHAEYRRAYSAATEADRALITQLPGFDADVFLEITGIDLRNKPKATCDGREVEIDGMVYVLKLKGSANDH